MATILLLSFLFIKRQCLSLINLSHLEVEDGHGVHFHIIETDFGIGAAVSLRGEKPEAHSTRLRKPILISVTSQATLAGVLPASELECQFTVIPQMVVNCYFIISKN